MTRDDIIKLAREAGFDHFEYMGGTAPQIHRFAALVAAAERERLKWDGIHSCGNDCQRPACVAVRNAVRAERERILAILDDMQAMAGNLHNYYGFAANKIREKSNGNVR